MLFWRVNATDKNTCDREKMAEIVVGGTSILKCKEAAMHNQQKDLSR